MPIGDVLPAVLARLNISHRSKQKRGPVLNPCEDRHRLAPQWHSCLFGAWRSVGSPPPDKAVWGRPPYVLPVWRNVITKTTEMILALVGEDRDPLALQKTTLQVGRGAYAHNKFTQGLEIPMAVTDCAER